MRHIRFRLYAFLLALLAVVMLGSAGFMVVEGKSLKDALYFCIVTISTVGYGDIHPVTPWGKLVAVLLIITGVGTFLGLIANATELMLNRREQQERLAKLNVVIGLFFSEVGSRLMAYFSGFDPQIDSIRKDLLVDGKWTDKVFTEVGKRLDSYDYKVDVRRIDPDELRSFFGDRKALLIRIMYNPNLHEHEGFTDMLLSVSHLREELTAREGLGPLPDSDMDHLAVDVQRAYRQMVQQWLAYLHHLKEHYPHLFSLAVRTNPFDRNASPVVGL